MRDLEEHLIKIAHGYGLDPQELLEGQTPRSVFDWRIRQADWSERLRLLRATPQARVKLALDVLSDQFPDQCDTRRLALASGLPAREVEAAFRRWPAYQPDRKTACLLADGLESLVGISSGWLRSGSLPSEAGLAPVLAGQLPRMGVIAQKVRPGAAKALIDALKGRKAPA